MNKKILLSDLIPTSIEDINNLITAFLNDDNIPKFSLFLQNTSNIQLTKTTKQTTTHELNTTTHELNTTKYELNTTKQVTAQEIQNFVDEQIENLFTISKLCIELAGLNTFKNFNLIEIFNNLENSLPTKMHPKFQEIISRSKPFIAHLNNDDKNDILCTLYFLCMQSITIEPQNASKPYPSLSFKSITKQKHEIELTKTFNLKKKIVWGDFLALYSWFHVLIAYLAFESQYSEEPAGSNYLNLFSHFKFYDQYFLSLIAHASEAIALAEDEYISRKLLSEHRKNDTHLTNIKNRLKVIYFEKYSKLSNRQASSKLYKMLDDDEKKKFKQKADPVENEETASRTIADWIKNWLENK